MSLAVWIRPSCTALLISMSGLLLVACGGSGPHASNYTKTPPSVIGSAVGVCASPPGQYGAAFVDGPPEIRDSGGTVRVRATFRPGFRISGIEATVGAIVSDFGNCFYSIHVD